MEVSTKTRSSVKSLWFVLGLIMLVVSTEMGAVHCRPLRSTNSTIIAAGCQQVDGSMGMASFVASSNSSSSRSSVRSLMFKLASGPSKRGPGH
ncbi:hypothetical protein OIU77_025236 [Salix suchowensis]|uniref:Secreted protein n=1 Tax=Salix suchowensis TaxID=1278906 RepID=A0ABQ9BVK6_9ROSI|nr:hypothetical protein OIU77_025236 [Salix suchowensis]